MKTLILMTALLLAVGFSSSVVADEQTIFSGYLAGVETAQFVDGNVIVDGSGNGTSSLGSFTITYHASVNPVSGKGIESMHIMLANGDTWKSKGIGQGQSTGLGALAEVTELHFVNMATGQFAGVPGSFKIVRMVDQATGTTSGTISGQFLKVTQ